MIYWTVVAPAANSLSPRMFPHSQLLRMVLSFPILTPRTFVPRACGSRMFRVRFSSGRMTTSCWQGIRSRCGTAGTDLSEFQFAGSVQSKGPFRDQTTLFIDGDSSMIWLKVERFFFFFICFSSKFKNNNFLIFLLPFYRNQIYYSLLINYRVLIDSLMQRNAIAI